MSFFSTLWAHIKPVITPIKENVLRFAESGLHAVETELKDDGIAAIKAAVSEAETAGGTGPEKFMLAKKALENSLKGANIPDALINLGIELAVQALKAAIA